MTPVTQKNTPYGESWQRFVTVTASLLWIIIEALVFLIMFDAYLEGKPPYMYLSLLSFLLLGIPGFVAFYKVVREHIWFRDMAYLYAGITALWSLATLRLCAWDMVFTPFLGMLLFGGGFIFLANTVVFACLYEWPYQWQDEADSVVA